MIRFWGERGLVSVGVNLLERGTRPLFCNAPRGMVIWLYDWSAGCNRFGL